MAAETVGEKNCENNPMQSAKSAHAKTVILGARSGTSRWRCERSRSHPCNRCGIWPRAVAKE